MLAATLGVGLVLAAAAPEPESAPPTDAAAAASPETIAAAKSEVGAARAAASEGRYQAAVAHFEAAFALHAMPQLRFNIAVCHHRAMVAAPEGSDARAQAQAAAIAAYNYYLALAPDAPDREKIEADIVALGGQPASETDPDWTPELLHPDAPAPPDLLGLEASETTEPEPEPQPQPEPEPEPQPEVQPQPSAPPPLPPKPAADNQVNPHKVSLGVFIPLVLANPVDTAKSDELTPAPLLGLGFRGGGFLGDRRRINLGGEAALAAQLADKSDHHTLTSGWLALAIRYGHPIGKRFEIGGGGLVAATGQTLQYTGSSPLRCGVKQSGAISQRTGALLAGRFIAAALLGKSRRHALTARVTPGLSLLGPGSASESEGSEEDGLARCADEPTPFEQFGLSGTTAFSVTVDFGYAVRI